jgi:hypothetical protein
VDFSTDQADRRRELQTHLQANREYYSRAVFRSLDAATLTVILGGYSLDGRPLIELVEPTPVAVAGNYLVLRAPVDDGEPSGVTVNGQAIKWKELLLNRKLDTAAAMDPRLIPIPTGGVFAEAVLGRSNAAEKLDVTRFWNWQDSPIPLTPPEIAAVSTGSRGEAEDLRPGQLGQPVVNLVNPTALPEPTSISAILNALAAMNFRDMSGLAGTQGLVSSAELATLDAATAAGRIASDNMRTEAQKAVAMGQIAADVAKAVIAAQVAKAQAKAAGGGVSGISRDGAAINHGRKMDDEARARSASGSGSGEDPPATDAIPVGGGSAARTDHMPGIENEPAAFRNLISGGDSGATENALTSFLASTGATAASAKTPTAEGDEPARPPFPDAFADPLTWSVEAELRQKFRDAIKKVGEDPDLRAFNAAGELVPVSELPIVIVALDSSNNPSYVGSNYTKMYYSGSLLKVAAMYAAFALRKAVADFANNLTDKGLTHAQVIARFRAEHDRRILAAAPNIPPRLRVVPRYSDILTVAAVGNDYHVAFNSTGDGKRRDFSHHLEGMIEDSHNPSAGVCIQALGYAWINGALRAAGFTRGAGTASDPVNGIWLAGDYLYGTKERDRRAAAGTDSDATEEKALQISGLEAVRVPCVNDRTSKQAATCLDLAYMFTQLEINALVSDPAAAGTDANGEMKTLLSNALPMSNLGRWLTRNPTVTSTYSIVRSKIGFGTLGTTGDCNTEDNCVKSEAMIIERTTSKRTFVVVWQNVLDPGKRGDNDYARIHAIIQATIAP